MHGMGDVSTPTHTPNETDFRTPTYTPDQTGPSTPTPTPVDSDLFYYSESVKIYLTPSDVVIGVAFQQEVDEGERLSFLSDYSELSTFIDVEPLPSGLFQIALRESTPWNRMRALLSTVSEDTRVLIVSPLFQAPGTAGMLLTPTWIVRARPGASTEQVESFNREHDVSVVSITDFPPERYYILTRIGVRNALDVLALANLYHDSPFFDWSTPNFQRVGGSSFPRLRLIR